MARSCCSGADNKKWARALSSALDDAPEAEIKQSDPFCQKGQNLQGNQASLCGT
jgi:hypothetical protein